MTKTSPRRIFRRPIRGVRVHVSRYGDGADEAERRRILLSLSDDEKAIYGELRAVEIEHERVRTLKRRSR